MPQPVGGDGSVGRGDIGGTRGRQRDGHGYTGLRGPDTRVAHQRHHIYVGLQTAVHGMMVWITDRNAGRRQDLLIEFDGEAGAWNLDGTASEWAHAIALELFPDSPYARPHRRPGTRRWD